MLVSVNLDFKESRPKDGRDFNRTAFWQRTFEALELDREEVYRSPDYYEDRLRTSFADNLAYRVNSALKRNFLNRATYLKPAAPEISISLLSIEYGSIENILEIFGIEESDIRDFVLSLLAVYSPIAFRDSTGLDVFLAGSAQVINEGIAPAGALLTDKGRGAAALGKSWLIANTSFILPFAMALFVCYYFLLSLVHELDAIHAERAFLQGQQTEIIKAFLSQSSKSSPNNHTIGGLDASKADVGEAAKK